MREPGRERAREVLLVLYSLASSACCIMGCFRQHVSFVFNCMPVSSIAGHDAPCLTGIGMACAVPSAIVAWQQPCCPICGPHVVVF